MLRRVMEGLTIVGLAAAIFNGMATGGQNKQSPSQSNERPSKLTTASRSISSAGQGQLMLEKVTSPYPGFLNPMPSTKTKAPLRIGGLCTDVMGREYSSFDPGFADCLSGSSGVFTGDYFGRALRRAGVGIYWK